MAHSTGNHGAAVARAGQSARRALLYCRAADDRPRARKISPRTATTVQAVPSPQARAQGLSKLQAGRRLSNSPV